jgi:3-methylfumaryl-CoA hydratase
VTAPTDDLTAWVGRVEHADDVLQPTPARALAATLDLPEHPADGDRLPELWHWLYFLPTAPASTLGRDGHPARGGFLPPVTLERRMWAGGRLWFHHDLRIGDAVVRTSQITSVERKNGRAGPMVLVTVRHTVTGPAGVAVEEDHDIVYVTPPPSYVAPSSDPLPTGLAWREDQPVDPVLLFRFSALTFNAHRIHYDRPYATQVEHYPGLVVHGPLQALVLLQAARRHRAADRVAAFGYRARRPLFDFDTWVVAARESEGETEVFSANGEADVAMRGTVTWRPADG